ncbi:sulfatase family protein [Carboxylicivirga marina]|uniref:sulfatase family protein n=1 Tax=Carboxylicivirga marina TaxID=2800988 RepID=UPI0025929136|nr:sulfatase [uncultured Carboxylicivirga sp.]
MKNALFNLGKPKGRRHFNLQLTVFAVFYLLVTALCFEAEAQERPNIIFLLADDHSYLSAGFNGNKVIKTPNLDKLSAQGLVFDNYYNTTSICMASRAQIMTGMLEYKTACNFTHGSLTKEQYELSYPVLLRKAGYKVAFAGKFGFPVTEGISNSIGHHTYDLLPIDQFDEWRGGIGQTEYETAKNKYMQMYADDYPHSSRAYGAWAANFIKENTNSKQPFCLSLSFKAPHLPSVPDPMFDEVYAGIEIPMPENYGIANGRHLAEQAQNGRQRLRLFRNYGYESADAYQESVKKYYQLIYGVDYAVGMIMKALKESGQDKNTVIIYTSDNGYHLGAHGFGGKVLPYEEAAKAPFIYFDPRHKKMNKGTRTASLVGNIDVAPTILALAQLEIPFNMDGKSLLPIVDNPKKSMRSYLPVMNMFGAAPTHVLSIQSDKIKYIYWAYGGNGMKPTEELFDKEKDPLEMKNEVNNPVYKRQLEQLQSYYDQEVLKIKKEGVDYNNYQFYKQYFDRHISWENKKVILPKNYTSLYKRLLK